MGVEISMNQWEGLKRLKILIFKKLHEKHSIQGTPPKIPRIFMMKSNEIIEIK